MDKVCSYNCLTCLYAILNGTVFNCKYIGYCDYQLPRDSRFQILENNKTITGENNV